MKCASARACGCDEHHRRGRGAATFELSRRRPWRDDYLQVIRFKTAKLFEAATRLGGDSRRRNAGAGRPDGGLRHASRYRLPTDDVLDYPPTKHRPASTWRRPRGRKPTLPLIHVMKHGTSAQAAIVRHAIQKWVGGRFRAWVMEAIKSSGALEETVAMPRQRRIWRFNRCVPAHSKSRCWWQTFSRLVH